MPRKQREVQLTAPPDLEIPDLRQVVGGTERLPEQELNDCYYDTGDRRLWSQGITLSHRLEGTPPKAEQAGVWRLDVPIDPAAPDRQDLRWGGDRTEPPAEALALLRGHLRRATLEMVAELGTLRRRLLLRKSSGEVWAEVDDDTVTVHNGPQDGLTFRKVNVDLVGSGHEQLDPVLAELRQAGARQEDKQRFAKILGADLAAGGADRKGAEAGHSRRAERTSIAAVVTATIASDLAGLLGHDVALRLDPGHPPVRAVHQARVATRRLRSDLKTLAPLLDPVWVGHTRAELKTAGEALGQVRDADVLSARLALPDHAGNDEPGMLALARRLDDERDRAAAAVAELIGSEQYLNLLDRLHAASVQPPLLAEGGGQKNGSGRQPAAKALPPLVFEQWKALRRRVRKAGKHPSDAQLHRIRIGAKQLRYASELSEPVVGKPARRAAAAAKALQDLLGDHHDLVTAEAWLRATGQAARTKPAAAFAAGTLAVEQQRRAQELRREWQPAWRQLEKRMRRR